MLNQPDSKKFLINLSAYLLIICFLNGCAFIRGRGSLGAGWLNLSEDRLADLTINYRQVGERDYLLFKTPERTYFLEGYLQGMVTDYQDNPIAGVVVTASLDGEEMVGRILGAKKAGVPSTTFDPGLSNTQGVYRIRFSLPLSDGMVDVRGRFIYNPQWEQERSRLGKAYEPQRRESAFRLYFNQGTGIVSLTEGVQRAIVQPVFSSPAKTALPGAQAPAAQKPGAALGDDLLPGLNFPP